MKKIITLISILFLSACTTVTQDGITKVSTLEDFKGKPSVIIIGGTYCPHCQSEVPIVKEKVWDIYKEQINLWVNVIDGGKFPVAGIPQGLNVNLDYKLVTGEECGYVPSWILLDKQAKVFDSSCGSEKSVDVIVSNIKKLLEIEKNDKIEDDIIPVEEKKIELLPVSEIQSGSQSEEVQKIVLNSGVIKMKYKKNSLKIIFDKNGKEITLKEFELEDDFSSKEFEQIFIKPNVYESKKLIVLEYQFHTGSGSILLDLKTLESVHRSFRKIIALDNDKYVFSLEGSIGEPGVTLEYYDGEFISKKLTDKEPIGDRLELNKIENEEYLIFDSPDYSLSEINYEDKVKVKINLTEFIREIKN